MALGLYVTSFFTRAGARSFGCLVVVVLGVACSASYTAKSIDARIIDADTLEPIDGAVVVANWQLVSSDSFHGDIPRGQLEVSETITNREGRFHFDGFTKRSQYRLGQEDPKIIVFKPGYRFKKVINQYPATGNFPPDGPRTAAVNGQTIGLVKYRGDYSEEDQPYWSLDDELKNVISDCEWRRIPRLIIAIEEESYRLSKEHPESVEWLPTIERLEFLSPRCGSAADFFRGNYVPMQERLQ